MRIRTLAGRLLRIAGILLIALGVVHLAATPHLPRLLDGMNSAKNYRLALGPTLLNHVLVGFLLIPLGYTTWLASSDSHLSERWARRILRVNAVVTLALPISAAVFMRQPEYYNSPLFVAGVTLAAFISLLVIISAAVTTRGGAD
jgi:hypothetical protein